ncbi:hypothetical protein BKA63DRAFT_486332 [Paraphoma chrysanthemicola]|nr:hypothetical protein BKA63DRAFT_486332 [Paraphoma chrysanthemicola]
MVRSKSTGPYIPTFKLTDENRNHEAYTHRTILNILRQHDRPHVIVQKSTDKKGMIAKWRRQDEAILALGDWRASDYITDGFDALPLERRVMFDLEVARAYDDRTSDAAHEASRDTDDSDYKEIRGPSDLMSVSEEAAPSGARARRPEKRMRVEVELHQVRKRFKVQDQTLMASGSDSLGDIEEANDVGDTNLPLVHDQKRKNRVTVWRAPGGAKMKYTVESDATREARRRSNIQNAIPAHQLSRSLFDSSPSPPEGSPSSSLHRSDSCRRMVHPAVEEVRWSNATVGHPGGHHFTPDVGIERTRMKYEYSSRQEFKEGEEGIGHGGRRGCKPKRFQMKRSRGTQEERRAQSSDRSGSTIFMARNTAGCIIKEQIEFEKMERRNTSLRLPKVARMMEIKAR